MESANAYLSYEKDTKLINYSDVNFPEDRIWTRIPDWDITLKISTFVPVIIFGFYGNFVILQLIVLNRALRTPTNMLVVNMAIADMVTLLICPVMFMINDFYQNYQLGSFGCKTEGFLDVAFLITAVLNLSAVSYDRLTAIVLPTETRLTMRGVKFVIAFTWLGGFLIAMPLAIYRTYKVRQWKNFREMYCKENTDILPKYWYVLITVMVWFPLSVMLICYSAIFYKLDRYEKRVLNREHPLSVSYKKKVAKTLFIVVVVFIALRLPFTILVILRDQYITNQDSTINNSFRIFWYISQFLMFLNSAVNPLIYGFNNDNFRRAYDQTPLCNCCKRNQNKIESNKTSSDKSCLSSLKNSFNQICCCLCLRSKKRFSFSENQHAQKAEVLRSVANGTSEPHMLAKETNLTNALTTYNRFDNEGCHNKVLSDDFI
ncbi:neuropeptide FF receptor 2 isoform X2 [Anastrepha obliqua]|uniref:neuropeptide FF receptor 2 isoform X2 n=1 Tax=Anastrepha obliqua TaxID=95512 RepID=UPI00240966EF|nr:neuropeptide FF receptor 2 isoform X2 [Anastrepha obliqua]